MGARRENFSDRNFRSTTVSHNEAAGMTEGGFTIVLSFTHMKVYSFI